MQDEHDPILSGILDDHFTRMANAVEEYMRQTKEELAEDRKQFFTPQIEELQAKLDHSQEEFANMQADAGETTNELVKHEAILAHLVQLSAKLHQKVRNSNNQSRAFNAWSHMGTDKALLAKVFKRNFLRNATRRIYFKRWIRKMHAKRENRVSTEIKKRYEKIWKAKATEAQRTIEELELELSAAREELETKQRNFLEMQQRLRKAFMRGVVNLNLEAMDVFNGAQFMDLMQEVEGNEVDHRDHETSVNESDDDFYVEEAPPISVIRHR
ncbi:hypothetical protein TRFO_29921 [Tritrichomonas foetus]|uniref:Centrosomal protein POC5 n=1 Tax=Tritrichomonas foetus TaxID=1144522 RepID=A0A1J4JZW3_9EUKA|nr:hypothetical protein TRFO_29921 [Tritrichomonas foetus]|eukprot:OHT02797.1 hypothetical protein TRFO_29921 [Tritrichomonas foetus]